MISKVVAELDPIHDFVAGDTIGHSCQRKAVKNRAAATQARISSNDLIAPNPRKAKNVGNFLLYVSKAVSVPCRARLL